MPLNLTMGKCSTHHTESDGELGTERGGLASEHSQSVPLDKEHAKHKGNSVCLGLCGSYTWWLAIHDESAPQLSYCILGSSFPSTIPQPSIPNIHSLNSAIKSQFLTSDLPVKSNSLPRSLLLATHLQSLYTVNNYFPPITVVFCCHSSL